MRQAGRRTLATGVATSAIAVALWAAAGTVCAAEPESVEVDEVVVTAQRRDQNLQDVPATVTAFGAEEVRQAQIQEFGDVSTRTPGVQFDAFPASQPRVAIRGVGSSDRGAAGDPSAAVFLDEIYLARPAAIAFDAFDLERIEVLKGPQGTLYGRNVVGGAVNVVTKRPQLDQFDLAGEATVGNYGRYEAAGVINAPLVEGKAAVRASLSRRTHDGYVKNTFTGSDVEDQDTLSGRLQLRLEPTETVSLLLALDGTRDRATGPAQHVLDLDASDPLSGFWTIDRDRDETAGAVDGFQNRDTWGLRGEARWDLGFGILTWLGSYRDLEYAAAYDFDGGNPTFNFIDIAGGNFENSTFASNELRLSSAPDSQVQWVVGLYRFGSDTERRDVLALDLGGLGTEIFAQQATTEAHAVFGDITLPVTDRISLIGGLRYSKDEKTYRVSNTEGDSIFRAGELFDVRVSDSYSAATYRVGAEFAASDDHLIYVMVSSGFKSGGFQDTPASAADAADGFEPEYATQIELGAKSSFLDGRLIWNNTLYLMDYTDLQTRRTLPNLTVVTDNAGAATIKGYETYVSWRPAQAFRLVASYAYTDGRFDAFEPEPGIDYSGNRMSRSPVHKLVLSPSYDLLLESGWTLRFAGDYRYESRIYDDNCNCGAEQRPATTFVDGRIILSDPTDSWTLSLWGKNLTDEVTRTFQATFLGANFGAYNPPRTYGLTFSWGF